MNRNLEYFKRIESEWRLEAKEEDTKYFYHTEETTSILNGEKSMVIGRKGEGKTAIATFIQKNVGVGAFSETLSFKNFPFNTLYGFSNNHYTKPSQYTTFWKYLIYISVCKQMIDDTGVDVDFKKKLEQLFPAKRSINNLKRLIPKITVKEFGAQILSTGFNISIDKTKDEIEWIDIVEILEELIVDNISNNSRYYIIFDELDEDYKDFTGSEEKQDYFDLITGLFKAVSETRNYFKENELSIFPVVFLRTDIYQRMNYSDKNKWSDYIINLVWSPDKLHDLIRHRIDVLMGKKSKNFAESWDGLVSKQYVKVGFRQTSRMKPFDYILRSTHNRPRDIVKYLKEASRNAIKNNHDKLTSSDIKSADNIFSDYMKSEIIDEIYSVLPEYEEIFAILSAIRKQTFQPQEFVNIYNEKVENESLKNRGAETVLKILFDFSIIGNVPSIKTKHIFKYENESARFNFREQIIVHRGLFKALQIF